MALLLGLLLMQGQDPPTIQLEANRTVLLENLPFTLTITAGAHFDGEVSVSGIRGVSKVRLVDGRAVLSDVVAEAETIRVTGPGGETSLRIRILPWWIAILPALLALLLMILTREIILALFAGVWLGTWILLGTGLQSGVRAIVTSMDTSLFHAVTLRENAMILLSLVFVGGMLGIIQASGGTKGFVDAFGARLRTRRSGMLATWFGGVVLFFDEFTNCIILGNTMRPLTDRLRISREKLSYLVDCTAGPITVLGLLSVFTILEMDLLVHQGFIPKGQIFSVFVSMVPYCFYPLFALFFSFLIAATRRDFGPMRRAEERALLHGEVTRISGRPLLEREIAEVSDVEDFRDRWHNLVVPVVALIVGSAAALFVTGYVNPERTETGLLRLLTHAEPFRSLLWGAMGAAAVAGLVAVARRHLTVRQAVQGWLRGGRSMFTGAVVLALAWALGHLCQQMSAGEYFVQGIGRDYGARWWPLAFFVLAAGTSAMVSTSMGTVMILLPAVGALAMPQAEPSIRLGCLAAVVSGSLLGNHLSPITNSMIFASMSAGADHLDHAKTQAPYAAICGVLAIVCGFVPLAFGVPPALCLILGAGGLAGVVFGLGRPLQEA